MSEKQSCFHLFSSVLRCFSLGRVDEDAASGEGDRVPSAAGAHARDRGVARVPPPAEFAPGRPGESGGSRRALGVPYTFNI